MQRYITWDEIHHNCNKIVEQVKHHNISSIIGLGRGGLIPATIIANALDVQKVYNIGAFSYKNIIRQETLMVYQYVPKDIALGNDTVLIVDDLVDSGKTIKELADNFTLCKFRTATLYVKPKTIYYPDYYASEVSNDEWLVFPWEKDAPSSSSSSPGSGKEIETQGIRGH